VLCGAGLLLLIASGRVRPEPRAIPRVPAISAA